MLKDNLYMLRKLGGYSQEQVAEKIGISRQAYAKWESGATVPDVEKAARLAELYGVTLDGLMRTETMPGVGTVPPGPQGKSIWGSVILGERGQVVIPKAARDGLGLRPGERLIVATDEVGVAFIPAEFFERKMAELMDLVFSQARPSSSAARTGVVQARLHASCLGADHHVLPPQYGPTAGCKQHALGYDYRPLDANRCLMGTILLGHPSIGEPFTCCSAKLSLTGRTQAASVCSGIAPMGHLFASSRPQSRPRASCLQ